MGWFTSCYQIVMKGYKGNVVEMARNFAFNLIVRHVQNTKRAIVKSVPSDGPREAVVVEKQRFKFCIVAELVKGSTKIIVVHGDLEQVWHLVKDSIGQGSRETIRSQRKVRQVCPCTHPRGKRS